MKKRVLAAIVLAGFSQCAEAATVTTNNFVDPASYGFDVRSSPHTPGPVTFAIGDVIATYTSSYYSSVIGYDGIYGLGDNNYWVGRGGYAGVNTSSDTLRFTFDKAVAAVGGFVNYSPSRFGDAVLRIFGAGNTLLETFNLTTDAPVSTPLEVNGGAFRGFTRENADIFAFEVSGAFAVIDDLTISGISNTPATVPLPASMPLLASTVGGLALLRRRRT